MQKPNIFFRSKYKSLADDLSYYWNVTEDFNNITSNDVIMVDIDKITEDMFNYKALIWGIDTKILSNTLTLKIDDIIRIPYDLEYIMFKLNKL